MRSTVCSDADKAYFYGDEVTKAANGTYTVRLTPWCDEPIEGVPTRKIALHIAHVAHEAMREYHSEMSYED